MLRCVRSILGCFPLWMALCVPVAAQVAVPECPAGEATLLVTRDAASGEVILDWTDAGCEYAAERSLDPQFPDPGTDLLADPFRAPAAIPYRDSSAPSGLVFYRLGEWDAEWPFWEACRRSPGAAPTVPMTLAYDDGNRLGWLAGFTAGDVEAVHFVPTVPMVVNSVRIMFGGNSGPVEIHIWGDYGRSWPDESNDLVPPMTIPNVPTNTWVTLDLSALGLQVHPRDHFWVGYVHLQEQPYLSVDAGSNPSHSKFKDPDRINPPFFWAGFQDNNQYMVRVDGEAFCEVDRPIFVDRSADFGIDSLRPGKIAWGDVDGDRYDDLLYNGRNLLHNDAGTGFTDVSSSAGLDPYFDWNAFGVFADVDNDRDQDLFIAVDTTQDGNGDGVPPAPLPGDPNDTILLNDGNGVFAEVPAAGFTEYGTTAGASFGDFDADGNLDLYVGNWLREYPYLPSVQDWLFRGNGDGTFVDITDASGMANQGPNNMPSYGVALADYDNDNDLDIFVSNYGRQPNFLWENQHSQGSDTFIEVAASLGIAEDAIGPGGGNGFGHDWGDFDADGDLDLFIQEIAHPRYQPTSDISSLQVNQGAPNFDFVDERETRGIHYDEGGLEASWVDFDNDGDLDLMLSYLYPVHFARLYRQNEDGNFTDITYEAGIFVHDATSHAWADYDRDGDLDLAITNRGAGSHLRLYENNEGADSGWASFRVEGRGCDIPGECNCSGIGARIYLTANGVTQIREIQSGKGHRNAQPSIAAEFGLGDAEAIDELRVRWPCGLEEIYSGAELNRFQLLREGQRIVEFE